MCCFVIFLTIFALQLYKSNIRLMQLSSKAIDAIKSNTRAKTRLALVNDCSVFTIDRWLSTNNIDLTRAGSLQVIREETGLTDSEVLEETPNSVGIQS